jgi:hypothetical protein
MPLRPWLPRVCASFWFFFPHPFVCNYLFYFVYYFLFITYLYLLALFHSVGIWNATMTQHALNFIGTLPGMSWWMNARLLLTLRWSVELRWTGACRCRQEVLRTVVDSPWLARPLGKARNCLRIIVSCILERIALCCVPLNKHTIYYTIVNGFVSVLLEISIYLASNNSKIN